MKILSDNKVSFKAKGLYATMVYMQENNINISLNSLGEIATDGITSLRNAIKELLDNGYLERGQLREGNLIKGYQYILK